MPNGQTTSRIHADPERKLTHIKMYSLSISLLKNILTALKTTHYN